MLSIQDWEDKLSLEKGLAWEEKVFAARATPCNHDTYKFTIEKITELISFYNISADVEGSTISPLHYLFAKYIDNDEMMPRLIEKIQNLDPKKINVRGLVTLRKEGASDPRKIESDSFLDGGMFLLWALRYNRVTLL